MLLDLLHLAIRRRQDLELLLRYDHVVHADRDTGAGRVLEARVHELVGEYDGLLEPHGAIAQVDRCGNDLLGHVLVDRIEGQALGEDLR